MKRIIVTVELELTDISEHPSKWIEDAIKAEMDISAGEDITDIGFEDITEEYVVDNIE